MTSQSSSAPGIEVVHRKPRFLAPPPNRTGFEIPAPPTIDVPQPPQMAMILIPALTSGSILIFGIISKQFYLVFLGIMITVASMAAPILMNSSAKRTAKRRNELRHQRYGELLDRIDAEINRAATAARAALETAHPTPDQLWQWLHDGRLWERRASDPDFLDTALGVAHVPSGLTVSVGTNSVLEAEVFTDLQDRVKTIERAALILEDAPFCLSLKEHAVLSVEGPRTQALSLAQAMLLESVVCCGPDELSLLVATPPEAAQEWNWAALVPHALHRTETRHAVSTIATSAKDLGIALTRAVGPRIQALAEGSRSAAGVGLAHLIIVLDVFHPLSELQEVPLLQEALSRAQELGLTVLIIASGPGSSPAEATAVVTIDARGTAVMRPVRNPRESVRFMPLSAPAGITDKVAATMSDLKLVTDLPFHHESGNDLLLDLLNRRPLPAAPPSWPVLPPRDFLTATFGVQADGRPFRLDLKEGAVEGDGPHGLLVGATGSGKSELLRSMVTSLALTHSPDWLQMAFVDFKGGAAFDTLAELPHCVGLITNILDDLSLIERMRSSLSGELLTRQRQIAATGLDLQGIRDYWSVRETRPDLPPMPYLLVIIDEFAELLNADPDFLDLLLTVGRQGRSLGVHLILASQRLEGGGLRGLESYLSYRIALRAFNADESNAAIGSKVAATLPPVPGHGYFKAGGALQRFRASQVSVDGDALARSVPLPPVPGRVDETDLIRVVTWLSTVPKAPPLWLRPLPNTANGEILAIDDDRLTLAPGQAYDRLPVVVGLLDDPQNRLEALAVLDTTQSGGHVAVVGAPQSGKSSAMVTQVLQAARTYPASLLRYFILNFGGGELTAARGLPNVGAYATAQEPDRVARVVTEMLTLLDERAMEFRQAGVSGMAQQRMRAARAPGEAQAHTVLIVDNYAAFKERYPEHEPAVERLLVEGANFGLHVHLTSARWADIGARKLDQIANRIELRLNDPMDSTYGRIKASAIRTSGPGRGLGAPGLQLQFAAPFLSQRGTTPDRVAATVAEQARIAWNDLRTPPLRLLDDLTAAEFRHVVDGAPARQTVLGVNESGFRPVLFEPGRSGNLLLFGDLDSGRTATLGRILTEPRPLGGDVDLYVVDFRGDLIIAIGPNAKAAAIVSSPDEARAMVGELKQRLDARMLAQPTGADSGEQRPIMLVVDDFELVQAVSGMGQGLFADISPHLLLAERLGFSAVVNQLAANSMTRLTDAFIRRALESGASRMHFSVASRAEPLLGGYRGRLLPPGLADVIRPGHPNALIRTLSPT